MYRFLARIELLNLDQKNPEGREGKTWEEYELLFSLYLFFENDDAR